MCVRLGLTGSNARARGQLSTKVSDPSQLPTGQGFGQGGIDRGGPVPPAVSRKGWPGPVPAEVDGLSENEHRPIMAGVARPTSARPIGFAGLPGPGRGELSRVGSQRSGMSPYSKSARPTLRCSRPDALVRSLPGSPLPRLPNRSFGISCGQIEKWSSTQRAGWKKFASCGRTLRRVAALRSKSRNSPAPIGPSIRAESSRAIRARPLCRCDLGKESRGEIIRP